MKNRLFAKAGPAAPESASLHDEAALIRKGIEGSAQAFGLLYLHHLNAIYRYVFFRVGNHHDAEDLTEQVFLKAWEALPKYEERGHPFSSWLYRIAHNVVVEHHRRESRMAVLEPGDELLDHHGDLSPLEALIQAEEIDALASAVRQLSDEQQQVVILRFIEGLSHAEVAGIVGKSEGACRVIQYRALAELQRLLMTAKAKPRKNV